MQFKVQEFSIADVIRMIEQGEIALPDFQRAFVWDPDEVIELLESIANGWPLGNLLFIEAPQALEVRKIEGGPEVDRREPKFLLLDGQQRLTSVFHAFTGSGAIRYWVDFSERNDRGLPAFAWTTRKSGVDLGNSRITLAEYLNPALFRRAVDRLTDEFAAIAVESRNVQLGELVTGSYRFIGTVLEHSIDSGSLAQIFETLNRTGARLGTFDLAVASTYTNRFSLKKEWKHALSTHSQFGDFKVQGIEILRLLALQKLNGHRSGVVVGRSTQVLGIRQSDVLKLDPAEIRAGWSDAVAAYAQALQLSKERFGLVDVESLPSRTMLLAIAFWLSRGESGLDAWYWSSIAAQTYAQGANTRVVADTSVEHPTALPIDRWQSALISALQSAPTQNRILRTGLRGLLLTSGVRNPLTGKVFSGALREAPLFAMDSSNVPLAPMLVDCVWVDKRDLAQLKRRVRQLQLHEADLGAQRVPALPMTAELRERRFAWFVELFEGRVR